MNLSDVSEEEPEELFPDSGKPTSTSNRESRKEREEKLKKMMEDDEEEEQADYGKMHFKREPLQSILT